MTTYDQIKANRWRTALLFLLFGLLLVIVSILGGLAFSTTSTGIDLNSFNQYLLTILPIAGVFGLFWSFFAYFAGGKMIVSMSGAKEIKKSDDPELYRLLENLSISEGLPMPKLYIMDDMSLNAFATGRDPNHSIVVVTKGLREILNKEELEGVLAHELSHIKNKDIRVMLLATVLVGILQLLADFLIRNFYYSSRRDNDKSSGLIVVFIILIYLIGYIGGVLVQLAISRKREYLADASAGLTTRNPDGLISALQKISKDSRLEALDGKSSIAHLCIANPFEGKNAFLDKITGLFATHPPIDKRIEALKNGGF